MASWRSADEYLETYAETEDRDLSAKVIIGNKRHRRDEIVRIMQETWSLEERDR